MKMVHSLLRTTLLYLTMKKRKDITVQDLLKAYGAIFTKKEIKDRLIYLSFYYGEKVENKTGFKGLKTLCRQNHFGIDISDVDFGRLKKSKEFK